MTRQSLYCLSYDWLRMTCHWYLNAYVSFVLVFFVITNRLRYRWGRLCGAPCGAEGWLYDRIQKSRSQQAQPRQQANSVVHALHVNPAPPMQHSQPWQPSREIEELLEESFTSSMSGLHADLGRRDQIEGSSNGYD